MLVNATLPSNFAAEADLRTLLQLNASVSSPLHIQLQRTKQKKVCIVWARWHNLHKLLPVTPHTSLFSHKSITLKQLGSLNLFGSMHHSLTFKNTWPYTADVASEGVHTPYRHITVTTPATPPVRKDQVRVFKSQGERNWEDHLPHTLTAILVLIIKIRGWVVKR